jgi:hypothetical protein
VARARTAALRRGLGSPRAGRRVGARVGSGSARFGPGAASGGVGAEAGAGGALAQNLSLVLTLNWKSSRFLYRSRPSD